MAVTVTLFDGVVAVAVGVVGHVSQQGVVRVRVLGAQAVGIRGRVRAAPPRELAWKKKKEKKKRGEGLNCWRISAAETLMVEPLRM